MGLHYPSNSTANPGILQAIFCTIPKIGYVLAYIADSVRRPRIPDSLGDPSTAEKASILCICPPSGRYSAPVDRGVPVACIFLNKIWYRAIVPPLRGK